MVQVRVQQVAADQPPQLQRLLVVERALPEPSADVVDLGERRPVERRGAERGEEQRQVRQGGPSRCSANG